MRGLDDVERSLAEQAIIVCPDRARDTEYSTTETRALWRLVDRGIIAASECGRCRCLHPELTASGKWLLRIVKSLDPK